MIFIIFLMSQIFAANVPAMTPSLQQVCMDHYQRFERLFASSQCTLKEMNEAEKRQCKSLLQCQIQAELDPNFQLCLPTELTSANGQISEEQKKALLNEEKQACEKPNRMECSYEPGRLQGRPTGANPNTTMEDCLVRTRPLPTSTGTAP